jgi:hypothetical protein
LRLEPQGEQRGAGEHGAGGQVGIDGGGVGEQRRAEADRGAGAERPRIGGGLARQRVRERDRKRGDGGEEELDRLVAAERVGGQDQQREADPVGLVEAAGGELAPRSHAALGVLVEQVHVAVVLKRFRCEQVVARVPVLVVEPERGRVDAEQQQPQDEGAAHGGAD